MLQYCTEHMQKHHLYMIYNCDFKVMRETISVVFGKLIAYRISSATGTYILRQSPYPKSTLPFLHLLGFFFKIIND